MSRISGSNVLERDGPEAVDLNADGQGSDDRAGFAAPRLPDTALAVVDAQIVAALRVDDLVEVERHDARLRADVAHQHHELAGTPQRHDLGCRAEGVDIGRDVLGVDLLMVRRLYVGVRV